MFVPICFGIASLCLVLRVRNRSARMPTQPIVSSSKKRRRLVDPRILELAKCNVSLQTKLILGVGCGELAREFAREFPQCLVVAMETDALLSVQSSRETEICGLQDQVIHVQLDGETCSINPLDIVGGKQFDLVFIGNSNLLEKRLAWVARAMKPNAMLIAEAADLNTVALLDQSGLFHFLRVCRGMGLGRINIGRKHLQEYIAAKNSSSPFQYPFTLPQNEDLEYLICGQRNSIKQQQQYKAMVRPIVQVEKTPTARRRDKDGFRARAGAIVVDPACGNRVLLISSLKRPGEWTLPAGGVEFGEGLEAAVLRETMEESGCECTIRAPLTTLRENGKKTETHFFLIELVREASTFDENTLRRRIWVDIQDALLLCSSRYSNFTALQLAMKILR